MHGASRNAATIGPATAEAAAALAAAIAAAGGLEAALTALRNAALRVAGRDRLEFVRRAGPEELDDHAFATLASGINTIRLPKTAQAATYSYIAHFAEVRVRPDRGTIRVTRMLARCDIGRVLNPMQARSQILGGLVFGIGMALTEQVSNDPATGRVISGGITEYWLPGMAMMPAFDIAFVGAPDLAANPLGAKSAGELGVVGAAAAIANAVWHATGQRHHALPITADKLLSAPAPA